MQYTSQLRKQNFYIEIARVAKQICVINDYIDIGLSTQLKKVSLHLVSIKCFMKKKLATKNRLQGSSVIL